jgi:hypothetical protein
MNDVFGAGLPRGVSQFIRPVSKLMVLVAISACSAPPVTSSVTPSLVRVAPYGYADGLAAKRAAEAICARQGKRLNPKAYGHFNAGAWEFAGGCHAYP